MPRSTSALFGLALLLARPALTQAQPGQGTGTAFTKVLKLSDKVKENPDPHHAQTTHLSNALGSHIRHAHAT